MYVSNIFLVIHVYQTLLGFLGGWGWGGGLELVSLYGWETLLLILNPQLQIQTGSMVL